MHLLNTVLTRLEKHDPTLPVVLKDSDLLLGERLSYFETRGWKCLILEDIDREFLTHIEAESHAQSGRKVLVYIANRSESDLVFLAEYCDRGNTELVSAINLLSELKIDRKDFKKDFLVSLVKYGLTKEQEWWQTLKTHGIERINKMVMDNIWELLSDSSYATNLSDAEKEFIFTHFANRTFNLKLSPSSSPEEASTLIGEKILEASFKSEPRDEVYDYYKDWIDSNEWGESIRFHAERFTKSRRDELMAHIDVFESDRKHPFTAIERELYDRRIAAFLNGQNAAGVIEFAKERVKKRKEKREDRENGIYWEELVGLEPLLSEPDLTGIDSLQTFLSTYKSTLWLYDSLDRKLRDSHLPERLKVWAMERVSKINTVVANHWTSHYNPNSPSEQPGLLHRILREEGRKAVIVVDALRYELTCELKLKSSAKIENHPILAVTPPETAVGMGALYSSGNIVKTLNGEKLYIVDQKTGRTLESVADREENLKELIPEVQICEIDSKLRIGQGIGHTDAEKIVFKTRDIDSLGHNALIEFFRDIMIRLSKLTDELLRSGYEVHFTGDHGFYLPLGGETVKQDGAGSYASGARYSLNTTKPNEGKVEEVSSSYVHYADIGNVFNNYADHFWHGGITHQEVIIPHLIITPLKGEKRWGVKIANKERLKILQKDRFELLLFAEIELFGCGPRVYVQYLDKREEIEEPVDDHAKVVLEVKIKSGETFKIEVRDLEDGSLLDWVECKYMPTRERFF